MSEPADLVTRSQQLLELAGFAVLELVRPVHQTWQLVALTGTHAGVMLVAVCAHMPDPLHPRLALPGGFPPHTRRLAHAWSADAVWPQAVTL